MASKQQNLDFVLEQLTLDGVTSRKMFGEYAIYYRDRIVALFCDDQLFIKPTNAGRTFMGKVSEVAPYPGAKPWLFISGDLCEDGEWLSDLVRRTADELPLPKPKSKSKLPKQPPLKHPQPPKKPVAERAKPSKSPKKSRPERARSAATQSKLLGTPERARSAKTPSRPKAKRRT